MTQDTDTVEAPVDSFVAPARLTSDHRHEFRRAVLEALEQAAARSALAVEIDLSTTIEMDASGLGVLVLLQKRARERGLTTRLINTQHNVRSLLALTKLESLFEFA